MTRARAGGRRKRRATRHRRRHRNCHNREYYFSLCLSVSFNTVLLRVCVCCYVRDTKKRFSFALANVSRVSNFIWRAKSNKCVRYLAQEEILIILICGGEWNESVVSRARESHKVFFFEIARSFFCVCGQLNFSRVAQNRSSSLSPLGEKKLYRVVCF